jgi:hypothetical protein
MMKSIDPALGNHCVELPREPAVSNEQLCRHLTFDNERMLKILYS